MKDFPSKKPNDYLILSVIATFVCNTILGIVAIIKSFQVNSRWDEGDYVGAEEASKSAKRWAIASIIVAAIFYTILIIEAFILLFLDFKIYEMKFNLLETILSLIQELFEKI